MATRSWDPFQDLMAVQKRMNRLFESALTAATTPEPHGPVGWRPPADVFETDERLEIAIEIAGLRREDIEIEVGDGSLSVHGERQPSREGEAGRFYQLERAYGPFVRQFRLPDSVDRGAIAAQYREGILHITLPKRSEAKRQQIRVVVD